MFIAFDISVIACMRYLMRLSTTLSSSGIGKKNIEQCSVDNVQSTF